MNLSDIIANYKTTPKNEIRKVNAILSRTAYFWSNKHTLIDLLEDCFLESDYSSIATTYDEFCTDFVFNRELLPDCDEDEALLIQYCFLCELIYNLLHIQDYSLLDLRSHFENDINQLINIIDNGLGLLGYEMVMRKKVYITKKRNIVAESIASNNKTYTDDIFDYLFAKTTKDKENALNRLSIKLEAMEPENNYVKQNKKYVQLLRHKEEKVNDPIHMWFFNSNSYRDNLNKLFNIFLFMISYNHCSKDLKDFDERMKKQ